MATALALIAAAVFALSTVLQQRGGLQAPPLSLRHPASFLRLAGQLTWVFGFALLVPAWILQAMALDRGRVAVVQPIFTMTIVFVLPLGWWLTAQAISLRQVIEAGIVVVGVSAFAIFGDPAGGRDDAPNWQWFASIVVIVLLCVGLLTLGGDKSHLSVRAGVYGAVSGILAALAAVLTKPTVELLHAGGVGGVLGNWMVYALGIAGLLSGLLQQVGLQTGRLAPAVATGSVANPLVSVLLGVVLLQERLAPPTWHKVVALAALGCALAAAAAIARSEDPGRGPGWRG